MNRRSSKSTSARLVSSWSLWVATVSSVVAFLTGHVVFPFGRCYAWMIFPVRIRSKMKRYHNGKSVKRYHLLELTIPSRFKEVVEPFMDKDLMLNIKRKDDRIIIEAKAVDASHNSP